MDTRAERKAVRHPVWKMPGARPKHCTPQSTSINLNQPISLMVVGELFPQKTGCVFISLANKKLTLTPGVESEV